tara:strand:+ start:1610 stop:2086 length:477 start_codon:yes stop_codon:yes gene_type:complete
LSKYQRVASFESNGGFLLGSFLQFDNCLLKALPTRDAMLIVLAYAGNNTISNLVSKLPKSFTASDRLRDFSKARSAAIIELAENNLCKFLNLADLVSENVVSIDKTDGLRMTMSSGLVIHFRLSGNAPELRCYVESNSQNEAEFLIGRILEKLNRVYL